MQAHISKLGAPCMAVGLQAGCSGRQLETISLRPLRDTASCVRVVRALNHSFTTPRVASCTLKILSVDVAQGSIFGGASGSLCSIGRAKQRSGQSQGGGSGRSSHSGSRKGGVRMAASSNGTAEELPVSAWEDLLRGGEVVADVLSTMADLMAGIENLEEDSEMAVQLSAAAAVSAKMEELDQSFLIALDYMIKVAEEDEDAEKRALLNAVKEQTMRQLSNKLPPAMQVVSMLVSTKLKEDRKDVLCRAAAGGAELPLEGGGTTLVPYSKLDDIIAQADTLIESLEEKPRVADRRLLARLVLAREEARALMGGGLQDERNNTRGLKALSEPEVKFLSSLMSMKPGPLLRERLKEVMLGSKEGADLPPEGSGDNAEAGGDAPPKRPKNLINVVDQGRPVKPVRIKKAKKVKLLPVRPGIFLDTVTKVIGGFYKQGGSGVTVQLLEWIRKEVMDILQEIAHS